VAWLLRCFNARLQQIGQVGLKAQALPFAWQCLLTRSSRGSFAVESYMNRILVLAIIVIGLSGCSERTTCPEDECQGGFVITVESPDGAPIAGALIEGGVDWGAFSAVTDSAGKARLPNRARNWVTTITKDNFFPISVDGVTSCVYVLTPTPQELRHIGHVSGRPLRLDSGLLSALEYQCKYYLYAYDDSSVTQLAETRLLGCCVREVRFYGDTLWYTTHEDGIYVYSLAEPAAPQFLFHLAIPGYLGAFAVRDSIVAVGSPFSDGFGVYRFRSNGDFALLKDVPDFAAADIGFSSDYLVIVGREHDLVVVFDIENPADPREVYTTGAAPGYFESGFLLGDKVILEPYWFSWGELVYGVIDLADPGSPREVGSFRADSFIFGMPDRDTAVGDYRLGEYVNVSRMFTVLKGDMGGRFETVATLSEEHGLGEFGANAPPFFVIGYELWKLESR
jgi:hypothetical protein